MGISTQMTGTRRHSSDTCGFTLVELLVALAIGLLVMAAAWPLYTFSRRELAPVEDRGFVFIGATDICWR